MFHCPLRYVAMLCVVFTILFLNRAPAAEPVPEAARFESFGNYFALSLKCAPNHPRAESHDIVVVFDTSASQAGEFRTRATAVLEKFLESLDSKDRVLLMAADVESVPLTQGFVGCQSEDMQQGLAKLSNRIPLGATDMVNAMESAAGSFRGPSQRPRAVLYIGDGMSIGGLVGSEEFRRMVVQLVSVRAPVTSFAIGPRLDITLLAGIANQSGGALAIDGDDVTVEGVAHQLAAAATEVVVWPKKIQLPPELNEVYPAQIPPLRGDRDTILIGVGQVAQAFDAKLDARIARQDASLQWHIEPTGQNEDLSYLPKLVEIAQRDGGVTLPTIGTAGLREVGRAAQAEVERLNHLGRQALAFQNPQQARLLAQGAQALDRGNPAANAILRVAQAPAGPEIASNDELFLPGNPSPANPQDAGGALLEEFDRERQILAGKIQAEVRYTVNEARRIMGEDPQGAIDSLKLMLQNVLRSPELSANLRAELRDQLESALREADRQMVIRERVDIQLQEQEAVRREQERVLEDTESKERRLTQLMARFSSLMAEEMYRESEEVSDLARELDPTNPAIAAAGYNATMIDQITLLQHLKLARMRGMLATLASSEKAHIPVPDEPPILYPPAEVWQALTERRKEYASVSLERRNPAEKKILAALEEPTILEFIETPLTDVISYLKDLHQIPIVLDRRALDDGGIGTDTPITQESLRGLSLKSALRIMLRDLDLTYVIDDEVLQITTVEEADSRLVTKVYPVADLVLPIQNIQGMGGAGMGMMGGGMGGGMGGMGGGMMGGMGGGMMGGMGGGGGGFF